MDLYKIIKDNREHLKENTIRTYVLNIKRLNGGTIPEDVKFMENIKNIREKIAEMKLSTRRNMITSVMVVLSAIDGEKYLNLREEYRKELAKLNTEYEIHLMEHQKTLKEEENWTSIADLHIVLKSYMTQIRKLNLHKDIEQIADKVLLQKALVAGLYLLFGKNDGPRRLEYAGMKIIQDRDDIKPNINYLLVLSKRTKYFIFQDYKTSGKYGKLEKSVPNKLNTIINIWLKHNKTDNFLINQRGGAMTSNTLGKFITLTFAPLKKNITLNLLRHIFITSNVDLDKVKNNKELAKNMAHDVGTQETYVKV